MTASSLEHYLTRKDQLPEADLLVKGGVDSVLPWLATDGIGLKKMALILNQRPDGQVEYGTLDFTPVSQPADLTLIPIYM